MFEVVKNTEMATLWVPVNYNVTLYVGQLVYKPLTSDYFVPLGAASGASTNKAIGVVVATNNKEAVYNTTYKANSIGGVSTQAAQLARKWQGVQGMHKAGDPIPMVQIKLIGPQTQIKGRIYDTTYGTVISAFSPSSASSTGQYVYRAEASATTVANNSTLFCRSGANRGIYRVPSAVSNAGGVTTNTFATYWPYAVATTDSFVAVNVAVGLSKIQFDSASMCVLAGETYGSNYYTVLVEKVILDDPGKEHVIFRFV